MSRQKFDSDHLCAFLKVQDIKRELNDVIISNSIDQILTLIGSNEYLLDMILKSSTKEQLNDIYDILKKEIQKFKTKEIKKSSPQKSSPQKSEICQQSHFNTISSESVENICSFLSRSDIKRFKITSRRISIVCLNEMRKYLMKICIAKNLLNTKHSQRILWGDDNTSDHKYKPPTTYYSIFEELERNYSIPQQHQIPIFVKRNKMYYANTANYHYYEIEKYESIPSKSSLILFDKRNITMLNSTNCKNMTSNDIFDYNNNALLILYYFDIHKQEIIMVKQLIIDNSVTAKITEEYIKNILIKQDNTGKYKKLKELMNTNDINASLNIVRFGTHSTIYKSDDIIKEKIISLIFQINPINSQSLNALKLQYEMNSFQRLFLYSSEFLRHKEYAQTVKIRFLCKDLVELKQNITDYMMVTNTFSDKMQNDIFQAIDKIFKCRTVLSSDYQLNFDVFKNYLSKSMMIDIIPINYIQIYDRSGHQWTYFSPSNQYEINDLYVRIKPSKYNIQIYSESQAPFPFNYTQFTSKEPVITTRLHIKNDDTVNDMVHKLIHDSFQDIQQSIDEYINSVTPNCYAVINKSFGTVYEPNDNELICNLKRYKRIKLFFLPFQNQDRSRTIKLEIRFSFKNQKFNTKTNVTELEFTGLPLLVFIDRNDTLQHVLMNADLLQKYKYCIHGVYKVDVGQKKVTSIPQSKRNTYKLWRNVLSKNSQNFIVLKIINRSSGTMYTNQYGLKSCKFVSK